MAPDIQRPMSYALAAIVCAGTTYSVLYDTYLDTSNPLLSHLPHPLGATHYFASKSNFLNVHFIKKAWGWTSAVFLFSWFTNPRAAPGAGAGRTRNNFNARILTRYLLCTALWLLFTGWFFGPALLDRVVVLTGGQCVLPPGTGPNASPFVVPTEFCFTKSTLTAETHPQFFLKASDADAQDPGAAAASTVGVLSHRTSGVPRLRRGHDVSGHIFLMTMSILLLTEQLQGTLGAASRRNRSGLHRVAVGLNALLIGIWLLGSAMTSVYFHSPLEKVTGFVLGCAAYAVTNVPFMILGSQTESTSAPSSVDSAPGASQSKKTR